MSDTWVPCGNWKFWRLVAPVEAFVCIVPCPRGNGFLWQCEKRFGYGETIKEAMTWVEALSDHFGLSPDQRWMTL